MAALYLHQALFANDAPSSPSLAHRSSQGHHDYPSLSTVTLHTSTSEHSHPTEPLLHGPYPQVSAYQDILSNQPIFSEPSRTSWTTALSLSGDPLTSRERKIHWERLVRTRLYRLRWARRVLRSVIGKLFTGSVLRLRSYSGYLQLPGACTTLSDTSSHLCFIQSGLVK
jgi:hypothetical protein